MCRECNNVEEESHVLTNHPMCRECNNVEEESHVLTNHPMCRENRSGRMVAVSCSCIIGYLVLLLMVCCVAAADVANEWNCTSYSAKLTSVPDLTRRIVHQERRHDVLQIVEVKNTDYERSYYWCQLEVLESDNITRRYRRFGFNASHWWVEQGCGGWFIVTECKADAGLAGLLDNAEILPVISSTRGNKLLENNGKQLTLIDEMYQSWPRMGYSFPTTGQMWDMLNNATHVDVAAQLGFYNNQRKPPSTELN